MRTDAGAWSERDAGGFAPHGRRSVTDSTLAPELDGVEHQLDARYAAARGFVDAIVYPEDTRETLAMALRTSLHNPGPHLGPFVLPPHLGEE